MGKNGSAGSLLWDLSASVRQIRLDCIGSYWIGLGEIRIKSDTILANIDTPVNVGDRLGHSL